MGEIKDIKIIQGIGYGCDEEVIKALKQFPFLKPSKIGQLAEKRKNYFKVSFFRNENG